MPLLALLSTSPSIDPAALDRLVTRCTQSKSWGLVVLRDGKTVVDHRFGKRRRWCNMMSATKSVTSMAVGALIGDGKLKSVDVPLRQIFPAYQGKWKDQVTVRHLLEHTSGIRRYQDDPGETKDYPENRVPSALEAPIVAKPGTNFVYNNRGADLLSGVVRQLAGKPLDVYVKERIFTPLGIKSSMWYRDPDGNPHGCAELHLMPTDMAKLGQLMLNEGIWEGKEILPRAYVRQATVTSQITKATGEGCGWLWWICEPSFTFGDKSWNVLKKKGLSPKTIDRLRPLAGRTYPNVGAVTMDMARSLGGFSEYRKVTEKMGWLAEYTLDAPVPQPNGGYYANGWGGQFILVLPKERIVAVRTGGEGFFNDPDASKYEMGDFYWLVKSLAK